LSTLTKICVVVVFVLSLLACAVFLQKVVTDANWKSAYYSQVRRANTNAAEARNHMLAEQNWRNLYTSVRDNVADLERRLQNNLDSKNAEIRRLMVQNAEFQGQLKVLGAQLDGLEKTLGMQIAQNKTLTDQLDKLRDERDQTAQQLIRARDQITEQQVQIEQLLAARRVLEERIAQLEQEIRDKDKRISELERQGGTGAAAGAPGAPSAPVPKTKIEGTVTAVKVDLASLNVGSADGVAKGMVFIIYRGAEFVAHLRVADVGTGTCAGVIYEAQRDVQVGDKATTKLE